MTTQILTSDYFVDRSANSGEVVAPTIIDNGNGTVTVSAGTYALASESTSDGFPRRYVIPGGTFAMTDQAINYIYADYSSGTPALKWTLTRDETVNTGLTTKIAVFTVFRDRLVCTPLPWDMPADSLPERHILRTVNVRRFERDPSVGGMMLRDAGSHRFSIDGDGIVWYATNQQPILAMSSATDTVTLYEYTGTSWNETPVTTFNNTSYQGATGFVTLTPNRYAVNFVYRSVQTGKVAYILLGTGDYQLTDAQNAVEPATKPPVVSAMGILVGVIIVKKGDTAATSVNSAFTTQIGTGTASNHNDLSGRNDAACHPASAITNTPAGGLVATTVQAALNELDTEKVPTTRTITVSSPLTGSGNLSSNLTISIPAATATTPGYATAAQIAKLDGIEANANNYVLPTATSTVLGGVKPDGVSILNVAGVLSVTPASIGAAPAGAYLTKLAKWRMRRGL